MRAAFAIAIVALLIPQELSAVGFMQTYDVLEYEDEAWTVLEMPDGGFALYRSSFEPGQEQTGVVFTDGDGVQTGFVPGFSKCFFLETDSTLVFVCLDEIVRTDLEGNILYSQATDIGWGNSALPLADGGFLTCGTNSTDGFLVRFDSSWNCVWSVPFDNCEIYDLALSPDGTIGVVGEELWPPYDGVLAFVESDGTPAGQYLYDSSSFLGIVAWGSNFILAGHMLGGEAGVMAVTNQGVPLWTYQSILGDQLPYYSDLAYRPGGQLVACGHSAYISGQTLGIVSCLTATGSLLWEGAYPDFLPFKAISTSDLQLAFCGFMGWLADFDTYMSALMLTDDEGYWGPEGTEPEAGPAPALQVLGNPVQGNAVLQVCLDQPGIAGVSVYDVSGRLCWSSLIDCGSQPEQLQVEGLAQGAYYAVARADGLEASTRFVVLR